MWDDAAVSPKPLHVAENVATSTHERVSLRLLAARLRPLFIKLFENLVVSLQAFNGLPAYLSGCPNKVTPVSCQMDSQDVEMGQFYNICLAFSWELLMLACFTN